MGVVFACIAPHGTEIIPELAGEKFEAFAETRSGMEKLAAMMKKQKPDSIILATPHNLRLEARIGVITAEFTEGTLRADEKEVKLRCQCNRRLAKNILEEAKKAKLPIVGANYGTSEGESSCMPMDWGTLIPLWFFVGQSSEKPKVVLLTPSREINFQSLIKFGQIVAHTAKNSEERIAFVASADQGHAHKADGPYGFHTASAQFDETVRQAVLDNNLKTLFRMTQQLIEDAKPDSLWQMAILQGVLDVVPMKGRLLSYQAPTYFGMLCAAYLPVREMKQ